MVMKQICQESGLPLYKLINACLDPNMDKRPTFDAIISELRRCLFLLITQNLANKVVGLKPVTSAASPIISPISPPPASPFIRSTNNLYLADTSAAKLLAALEAKRNDALVVCGPAGSGRSSVLKAICEYKRFGGYLVCVGSWEKDLEPLFAIRKALKFVTASLLVAGQLIQPNL